MQPHATDAGAALHQWLALSPMPADERARLQFQQQIWDYVDNRKAAGWSVERIIIAISQITRVAGLRPSSLVIKPDADITSVDAFLVEMMGWCIHRYYRRE